MYPKPGRNKSGKTSYAQRAITVNMDCTSRFAAFVRVIPEHRGRVDTGSAMANRFLGLV